MLPGTIKSYLSSVRHFYAYCVSENWSVLADEDNQDIQSMNDKSFAMDQIISKGSCSKRPKKMDANLQQLITPAQIEEFESSRTALHAVKLIGSVNGHPLKCFTQSDYFVVRD